MLDIKDILSNKRFNKISAEKEKKLNPRWEKATIFGTELGIKIPIIMKMFKLYGEGKVLGLNSWLRDYPARDRLKVMVWKLKSNS